MLSLHSEAYSEGGAMMAQHPLDQWNLRISEGIQDPTSADNPPGKNLEYAPVFIIQFYITPANIIIIIIITNGI